jgi:hypothetical protein
MFLYQCTLTALLVKLVVPPVNKTLHLALWNPLCGQLRSTPMYPVSLLALILI